MAGSRRAGHPAPRKQPVTSSPALCTTAARARRDGKGAAIPITPLPILMLGAAQRPALAGAASAAGDILRPVALQWKRDPCAARMPTSTGLAW